MYAKKGKSLFGTLPNRDSFCFLDLCFCYSPFAYGGYTNPHLVAFIKRSGFQTIFFFVIVLFSFLRKKPVAPFIIIFEKVNALLLLFYKRMVSLRKAVVRFFCVVYQGLLLLNWAKYFSRLQALCL